VTVDGSEEYAVVLTTAGSREQASMLARALVLRRLAACVNIVGPVRSVYRWKGPIADDEEHLLIVKTRKDLAGEVAAAVRALHSYELPEVLVLPVLGGDPDYLAWLGGSVNPETEG